MSFTFKLFLKIPFQSFGTRPKVLSTVTHSVTRRPQDALVMWLEEVTLHYFRICLREVKMFDGKHENIEVVRLRRGDVCDAWSL